jgi:hypothetical protein
MYRFYLLTEAKGEVRMTSDLGNEILHPNFEIERSSLT